jgi:hypothetical protein
LNLSLQAPISIPLPIRESQQGDESWEQQFSASPSPPPPQQHHQAAANGQAKKDRICSLSSSSTYNLSSDRSDRLFSKNPLSRAFKRVTGSSPSSPSSVSSSGFGSGSPRNNNNGEDSEEYRLRLLKGLSTVDDCVSYVRLFGTPPLIHQAAPSSAGDEDLLPFSLALALLYLQASKNMKVDVDKTTYTIEPKQLYDQLLTPQTSSSSSNGEERSFELHPQKSPDRQPTANASPENTTSSKA